MNNKGIIALLVVIVFLFSTILVLLVHPINTTTNTIVEGEKVTQPETLTETETTPEQGSVSVSSTSFAQEMKEYTNETLALSFTYPDTLTEPKISYTKMADEPLIASISLYGKKSQEVWAACVDCMEGGPDNISIRIYENKKNLTPEEWLKVHGDGPFFYGNYTGVKEDLGILGGSAIRYSWYGLGGADVTLFHDSFNGNMEIISAHYMTEKSTIRGDVWYIINSFSSVKK